MARKVARRSDPSLVIITVALVLMSLLVAVAAGSGTADAATRSDLGHKTETYLVQVHYRGHAREYGYGGTGQYYNGGADNISNVFGSEEETYDWDFETYGLMDVTRYFFKGSGRDKDTYFVKNPSIAWESVSGSGQGAQNLAVGCDPTLPLSGDTCARAAAETPCKARLQPFEPWTRSADGGALHVEVAGGALDFRMTEPGNASALRGSAKCASIWAQPSTHNGLPSVPGTVGVEEGPCPPSDAKSWDQANAAGLEPEVKVGLHAKLPYQTTKTFDVPTLKWYYASCPENDGGYQDDGPPALTEADLKSTVKVTIRPSGLHPPKQAGEI